jgi:hypothetical protein
MHLSRIAKDVVAERFGPNRKTRRDMIGSFIRHGLTQREAEAEAVLQLFLPPLSETDPPTDSSQFCRRRNLCYRDPCYSPLYHHQPPGLQFSPIRALECYNLRPRHRRRSTKTAVPTSCDQRRTSSLPSYHGTCSQACACWW